MRSHGFISTYQNGCRCDECRRAAAAHQRARRARTKRTDSTLPVSLRPKLLTDEPWMAEGACRGMDPAVFFPPTTRGHKAAKGVCARCPVSDACLSFALATGQREGIWGGLDSRQRWRLEQSRAS